MQKVAAFTCGLTAQVGWSKFVGHPTLSLHSSEELG